MPVFGGAGSESESDRRAGQKADAVDFGRPGERALRTVRKAIHGRGLGGRSACCREMAIGNRVACPRKAAGTSPNN